VDHVTDDASLLLKAVDGAPVAARARLEAASSFDAEELEVVITALADFEDPVAELARRMLERWDQFSVSERTAGLLLLAERLGSGGRSNRRG
jgi:hypothetical protein